MLGMKMQHWKSMKPSETFNNKHQLVLKAKKLSKKHWVSSNNNQEHKQKYIRKAKQSKTIWNWENEK
jgi:hypothetical protein